MMDARDRLLEYALERLEDSAPAPDLSARVAARFRAGERGPELPPELLDALAHRPRPTLHSTRPRDGHRALRRLAWIAGLGIAAAALFVLQGRDAPGPLPATTGTIATVARASAEVEFWRPEVGALRGRDLGLGDVLLVRDQEVELRLSEEGELAPEAGRGAPVVRDTRLAAGQGRLVRVAPKSVVALEREDGRPALELRIGELELAPGDAPLTLRTRYTALAAPADAALVLAARPEDPPSTPVERWLASTPDGPALHLSVVVLGGAAELTYGDVRESLAPGETRDLAARTEDGAVLVIDEARRLTALLDEAFGPWRRAPMLAFLPFDPGYGREAPLALAAFLQERPRRWTRFEAWTRKALDLAGPGPGPRALRQAVATFLAFTEGPDSLRLARALWLEAPAAFGLDAQLALAERGAFEFRRELLAALANPAYLDPVERALAGTWAALGGHEVGVSALEALVASPDLEDLPLLDYLLVTLGLERLGHPEAGALARERVRSAVLNRLAAGDRRTAGELLLQAELLKRRLAGREPPRLARLVTIEVASFVQEHASDVSDEARLRRLLDSF